MEANDVSYWLKLKQIELINLYNCRTECVTLSIPNLSQNDKTQKDKVSIRKQNQISLEKNQHQNCFRNSLKPETKLPNPFLISRKTRKSTHNQKVNSLKNLLPRKLLLTTSRFSHSVSAKKMKERVP